MLIHRAQIRYSAIGLVVALAAVGCTSTADPAVSPSPSSAVAATEEPSATAEPTTAPELPEDWEAVASFGDGEGFVTARAAVHGSAGFLIFGERWVSLEGGPRVRDRFIWRSADGTEWEELPAPEPMDDLSIHRVFTATADGEYLFLYQQGDPSGSGESRMIGLSSSDGQSWEEVDLGLPEDLIVFQLVRGEIGYLLTGSSGEKDVSLWLSEDGLEWESVHEMQDGDRFVAIDDVAAGDEGFVAFGSWTSADHSSYERFTLASGDGREWVEQPRPFGQDPQDYRPGIWVEGLGPDWVATIASRDASVRSWFSSDGLEWQESGVLEEMGTDMTWDPVLAELDGELVFTPSGNNGLGAPGRAFSSTDGGTWEPMDLGEQLSLGAATVGPDAHVLAGTLYEGDGRGTVTIWIRASR